MLKGTLGITLIALGVATANDTNHLLIPMALMAAGMLLMRGVGNDESAED